MSRPLVLALALAPGLLAPACAHLPELYELPEAPTAAGLQQRCHEVGPAAAFRAVHAIEARLPLGQASAMLGVSAADPLRGRLRAALVSAEGLTLFEGLRGDGGRIRVLRAVPPLDGPDFGPMLLDDVALLLLAPRGPTLRMGRMRSGEGVCRAPVRSAVWPGGVLDVLPEATDGGAALRLYDGDESLRREVHLSGRTPAGLYQRMRLEAFGPGGYSLELTLLESEPMDPDDPLFEANEPPEERP
ncbi:MAG TPA: hypothetical protein PK668_09290 [Myxococcota bacterium]|nr:hypothetical protein [Myxococcota bacterium]HRY92825.1 hypothetical protein [Myxococcota bacterium]HSA19799.1 hypothetical protein [Myxococcota bacterium]